MSVCVLELLFCPEGSSERKTGQSHLTLIWIIKIVIFSSENRSAEAVMVKHRLGHKVFLACSWGFVRHVNITVRLNTDVWLTHAQHFHWLDHSALGSRLHGFAVCPGDQLWSKGPTLSDNCQRLSGHTRPETPDPQWPEGSTADLCWSDLSRTTCVSRNNGFRLHTRLLVFFKASVVWPLWGLWGFGLSGSEDDLRVKRLHLKGSHETCMTILWGRHENGMYHCRACGIGCCCCHALVISKMRILGVIRKYP